MKHMYISEVVYVLIMIILVICQNYHNNKISDLFPIQILLMQLYQN